MLTLSKLVGSVALVTSGITGVVVLYFFNNKSLSDISVSKVDNNPPVKYTSQKGDTVVIRSFTIGTPAKEVLK